MIGFRAREEPIDPARTNTEGDGGVFQGLVPQPDNVPWLDDEQEIVASRVVTHRECR